MLGLVLWTASFLALQDPEVPRVDRAFAIQGEYLAQVVLEAGAEPAPVGVQVVALGEDRFGFVGFLGGLPGEGGDVAERTVTLGRLEGDVIALERSDPDTLRVGPGSLSAEVDGVPFVLRRVTRKSPTLGAAPPPEAIVLFDGKNVDAWEVGERDAEGYLKAGARTRGSFGSFQLHLEFRLPFQPQDALAGQNRGNSGVYLFDRYEVQILDSFGLHHPREGEDGAWRATFEKEWGRKPGSDRAQWCGALYRVRTPELNACLPPGSWQTYDIGFRAPRFEGERKVENARVTVRHNGVLVHDDVELVRGTGAGASRPEIPRGPIVLQAHGSAVQFRNVWLLEP